MNAFFSRSLALSLPSTQAAVSPTFTACMRDVVGHKRHQPKNLSAFCLQKSKFLGESRTLLRKRHLWEWAESPGEEEDAGDQDSLLTQ